MRWPMDDLIETPALLALTPEQRQAAQDLYEEMSDLSEEGICAGWIMGNEYHLWCWLQGLDDGSSAYPMWGDRRGGDIDKARVRALHERCGGWVVWDDAAGGAVYLPTGDWLARFKEVAGG